MNTITIIYSCNRYDTYDSYLLYIRIIDTIDSIIKKSFSYSYSFTIGGAYRITETLKNLLEGFLMSGSFYMNGSY